MTTVEGLPQASWSHILKDIRQHYPFLEQLTVREKGVHPSSNLPEALKVSVGIADRFFSGNMDINRLAMIFPLALNCSEWIAVGYALGSIKKDFLPAVENLTSFSRGQRLILDGKFVVEYVGDDQLDGARFMKVNMSAKSKAGKKPSRTTKWFPISERLRFQPAETRRPLTPIENLDTSLLDNPLDRLLNVKCYGNRSIFKNRVILLSRFTKIHQFLDKTVVVNPSDKTQEVAVADLFQWGGISVDGDLVQWRHQQVDAEPVLAVASDMMALRDYLDKHRPSNVSIILDGDYSLSSDPQTFEEILDFGFPVLAVGENRRLEDLEFLETMSFRTWEWSAQSLASLTVVDSTEPSHGKGPFKKFHRTVKNYSIRSIVEDVCVASPLDTAAERLQKLKKLNQENNPSPGMIERRFYNCLLNIARLLRPVGIKGTEGKEEALRENIDKAQQELVERSVWMDPEVITTGGEFVNDINALMSNSAGIQPKLGRLEDLLRHSQKTKKRTIVLADASEVLVTQGYWQRRLPFMGTVNVVSSEGLDFDKEYDHLIICGWLGVRKMKELHDSCIAPTLTVLMHPFEMNWFRSAVRRWRRQKSAELSSHEKAGVFRVKSETLPDFDAPVNRDQSAITPATDFDIGQFELQLREYSYMYHTPSLNGGGTTPARLITFSGDRYAWLRPKHRIPVVTDFVSGVADESADVPVQDISQLKIGDYVIFREGYGSDLLRDLADVALARAGKQGHKKAAGLWKEALTTFVSEHPQGFDGALVELWDNGLMAQETTVRSWIHDENRIGPQDEKVIEIIANVSGCNELGEQLEYVRRAIKEVRGAHRQAAIFLARKLISLIPNLLEKGIDSSHSIEIDEIGKAYVLRVEDIGDEEVDVAVSEVNCLFESEF